MILPPAPPPNRPKMASSSAKMAQDRSKTAPRPPQDLPKTILKSFFSHLLFCLRFGSDLGPTWAPFPTPWAPKTTPKSIQKTYENHVAARRPPRSLQDGPGPPTGRPKTTPDPPGLPPWGSPGPLQDPYRCPKRLPKGNKNHIIILFCVNNDDYEPDYDDRHDGSEDGDNDRAYEYDVSTHGEHKVAVS